MALLIFKNCCKGEDKMLGRVGVRSMQKFLEEIQHDDMVTDEEVILTMDSFITRYGLPSYCNIRFTHTWYVNLSAQSKTTGPEKEHPTSFLLRRFPGLPILSRKRRNESSNGRKCPLPGYVATTVTVLHQQFAQHLSYRYEYQTLLSLHCTYLLAVHLTFAKAIS